MTFHIAIAFDKNYLSPVYVLLASIFANNERGRVAFHAIAPTLSPAQQADLQAYAARHDSHISFYAIDENFGTDFLLPKTLWWTKSIYYRLLFAQLLPAGITRFLYLDTDIVVLKSLAPLFATDLGGRPLAAASDHIGRRPELGILEPGNYFNSGVLLIDKAAWLQQDVTSHAIAFLKTHSDKLINPDQDALNAVLVDNWARLDGRFNLMYQDVPADLTRQGQAAFLRDTVILHFTSQHKPWSMIGQNRLRNLYHSYLSLVPRQHRTRYADFVWNRHRLREMLEIRLAELALDYPLLEKIGLRFGR
ncbi:glycosyltransferase family 8 protein [uncultured Hymenobacter sp.]|uniref:glycosyltransferase family 8 protein n=1 Tax=uncultured Hymenobacter sp. TaxID=170016 RepID=UPI0035CB643C